MITVVSLVVVITALVLCVLNRASEQSSYPNPATLDLLLRQSKQINEADADTMLAANLQQVVILAPPYDAYTLLRHG